MSRTQKYQTHKTIKVTVDTRAIFNYERIDKEFKHVSEIASSSKGYGFIFFTITLSFLPYFIDVSFDFKFWILLSFGIISSIISILYFIRYFVFSGKSKNLLNERSKYEFDRFLLMNKIE
jgi:hypothetical protein